MYRHLGGLSRGFRLRPVHQRVPVQYSTSKGMTSPSGESGNMKRSLWLALIGLVLLSAVGCGSRETSSEAEKAEPQTSPDQTEDLGSLEQGLLSTPQPEPESVETAPGRESLVNASEQLIQAGKFAEAADALRRALTAAPDDIELQFRYASAVASAGDLQTAIEVLDAIPSDHPDAGLAAVGQSADFCMSVGRYEDAEQKYKQILRLAPGAVLADRKLANLLNRQGRRHEAASHIRSLCRVGNVRQDELHALMSLSDAMGDDAIVVANGADSNAAYLPIGAGGLARIQFTKQKYRQAADSLAADKEIRRLHPAFEALYGRSLIEAQDEQAFLKWHQTVGEPVKQYSEYWAAVGAYLISQQRFEESVRAFGEALNRDSTDARSLRRIYQALTALDKKEAAQNCFDRYTITRAVTLASNQLDGQSGAQAGEFMDIVGGLQSLGRSLESVTWELLGAFYSKVPEDQIDAITARRAELASSDDAFPRNLMGRLGIELDNYPIPKLQSDQATESHSPASDAVPETPPVTPVFENIAAVAGLDHTYRVASRPQGSEFSIYQSIGGGVAVLDFDLDGLVEFYLAQGGSDAPAFTGDQTNALYRTIDEQLVDVTLPSLTADRRYSIGVTSGDFNQDGFPDLGIANMGANVLLVNQGDGTFRRSLIDASDDTTILSTSLAIADVTGDALPDLIELNYADDDQLTKRPGRNPNGELIEVGPFDFRPGMDRILVNDGTGNVQVNLLNQSDQSESTGLGLVIADFDGQVGNEIFIGNDMLADHLWRRQDDTWVNDAIARGCAFSSSGARTATMGIAAADFDQSGSLDLHLTNYADQPATLYLNRGGSFADRAIQFQIVADSFPVLGFGCQGLDYDSDGRPDLVVTNGHVENLGVPNKPFEQPPQLFANRGDHFQLMNVADASGYFTGKHVGRAMARLDWNRDGKNDLVITHLESPTALLINRTEVDHSYLSLQVVGTGSERDAIGAKVEVISGERRWSQWVTAGDGYLCRNENRLLFGLGDIESVDEVKVTWPDGSTQSYAGVQTNARVLLIQGQRRPYQYGG